MMTPSSGGQDFDLNLAPIIDCFTVLITFMLVTASFLSVGIIDAGSAAATQPVAGETPPAVAVEVKLQDQFRTVVQLSGKSSEKSEFAGKEGQWDFDSVERTLQGIKAKWPATTSIVISASEDIEYLHLIQFMERIRKTIPGIVLGGY